ncbi:MAG: response regulator transcription factor [Gammaproteobacteria bacterium]|nr:response regulator transcription factor [Gammaproteobacteria bacterium]
MRILTIEDNRHIAANIAQFLEARGHTLDFAEDGITGLHLAIVNAYDVIVLDLMLPGMDGLVLCRRLREDALKDTPILMLTARDTLTDKLDGFSAGADDYLVKPFSLRELEARLLALKRRTDPPRLAGRLTVGDLEYNPATLIVKRAGLTIDLSPTTRKILALLMRATHRVVGRAEIEREIWGDNPPDSDALRSHIHAIRNAIDKPFPIKLLHTVHGSGYRLYVPHEN